MRAPHSQQPIPRLLTLGMMIVCGTLVPPTVSLVSAQSASMLTSLPANHPITGATEQMELTVKTSRVVSLDTRIPRFQVRDEEVLDANPVSDHKIQISAKKPGTTQVNVWDTDDKLHTIDVTVVADASPIDEILNAQLPLASLKVSPVNGNAIVSGFVTRPDDVARAVAIVEQFYETVIHNIQVAGTPQVLLHTRIMEVSRTKLCQLGLNIPWRHRSERTGATGHCFRIDGHFEALIQALEKQELVKVLAAPTVVASHGRNARFHVGGRVPHIGADKRGQWNGGYEEYGTSIEFRPWVIGPDRIRLEVRPEVSEPDPSRSVTIGSSSVPAFTTRSVETEVEMQAGQMFLLAGLLQSRDESVLRRTPVLGHVPGVGGLFRQVHCEHNEIELLITITPEIVHAMGVEKALLMDEDPCSLDEGMIDHDLVLSESRT